MTIKEKLLRLVHVFNFYTNGKYILIFFIILNIILTVTYFLKIDDLSDIFHTNLSGIGAILFFYIIKVITLYNDNLLWDKNLKLK